MTHLRLAFAAVVLAGCGAGAPTPPAPAPAPVAKKTLYFFSTAGCAPCRRMEGVLNDPRVRPQLARYDLRHERDGVAPPFVGRINGYPLFVIADGPDGPERSRRSGYVDPAAFAAWLSQY